MSIGLSNVSPSSSFAVQKVEEAALSKKKKEPLDFERAQLELKVEYDRKAAGVNKHQSTPAKLERAKLPKSTITKFNGTYEAWLPFWNKFIAVDASVDLITPRKKFAYLKQLIEPKVRVGIWELTKRRLWLDDAVGFRDMPIAHPHKRLTDVASKSTTLMTAICKRLKTAGREVSFRCFLPIIRVFLGKLFRGEQIVIVS